MKSRIFKKASAAVVSLMLAAGAAVSASAADVSVANGMLENDLWGADAGWTVDADWSAIETVKTETYNEWTTIPSSGSKAGANIYAKGDGSAKLTQTIEVPEGSCSVTVIAMGENASVKVSLGDSESDAVSLGAFNDWKEAAAEFTGAGGQAELTVTVDLTAGGYAYVDSVSVTAEETSDTGETGNTGDTGENGETGEEEDPGETGSTGETEQPGDTEQPSDTGETTGDTGNKPQTASGQVVNGDFETVSSSELVGWTVEWPEGLKMWYAEQKDKDARSDKNNNYLNIWTEKDLPLSLRQTVHLTPGDYKVTFNMDANEGVDTKVKLSVGSLTSFTLPKGIGWEKWAPCETAVFTVAEEGDYVLEFSGDMAAETWLCLDNIRIVTASAAAGGTSETAPTGAGESAAALIAAAAAAAAIAARKKS
ncbi:MAG: hypothetical protein IKP47_11315 [Ruminococcus sp.]|nr:hypothetical protein [Ruminococcus sp.]